MILIEPIKTEKAIGMIEFENKIIFRVAEKATKDSIKKEMESLFKVKVEKIRTYVTPKGEKRAIITLSKEFKAEDIASKLKMA
ncbi:50S ribosomal protein L23 [Candidatus Micrarchaeota archaeon]|nr:50S ribosomal protein L23 [Candidatus Micrarchaeota archaeon]